MQYENSYCEHDDEAYWILLYVPRKVWIDDSEVMDEDLSFSEVYETSMGLQMQIRVEGSHCVMNEDLSFSEMYETSPGRYMQLSSTIICNMNLYCEYNDVAYWLLSIIILLIYVARTVGMTQE